MEATSKFAKVTVPLGTVSKRAFRLMLYVQTFSFVLLAWIFSSGILMMLNFGYLWPAYKLELVWFVWYVPLVLLAKRYTLFVFIARYFVDVTCLLLFLVPSLWVYFRSPIPYFPYIGAFGLVFFLFHFIDRFYRIDYVLMERRFQTYRIIKKSGACNLGVAYDRIDGNTDIFFKPMTTIPWLAKGVDKIWYGWAWVLASLCCLGPGVSAAFGLEMNRINGGRAAQYGLSILAYGLSYGMLLFLHYSHGMIRFLLKEQKRLGCWLVNI